MTQQQYEDLPLPDHLDPDERDPEAPAADAAEQALTADPADDSARPSPALEVSEWDAAEQAEIVHLDDEYGR
ncbi:hypothetical protein GCM10010124_30180 [Pilimelia terevasa]|uniref:Uncharacterized protein n=1 Tax=Pilimelia terevasa TaxID=53372 RepID=A0A8J3BP02_9ACTN|nr:hypothetical protein [Pilimelia terevasa]GGK35448.1 hypothetical protein GCM10010124_30180 [Pilimelia terevasa]